MGVFKRNKKKSLREFCREKYGDEFIELYDKLGSGEPIGNFAETAIFLEAIERAKAELRGE